LETTFQKKICLLSDLHLSNNPRVWKEARTLAAAGYRVVILTIWTSAAKRDADKKLVADTGIEYRAAVNLIPGESNLWLRFYDRFTVRLSREIKKLLKTENGLILGHAPGRMVKKALSEKADMYIGHTEYGLMTGSALIKKGMKVAFDIEDWYSHDYLVPERPVNLLKRLEKFALEHSVYCTCPSEAMAKAIKTDYNCEREIAVIYNGFPAIENKNIGRLTGKHNKTALVWFSQTIGEGRGLETLFQALALLKRPVSLDLIGECSEPYRVKLVNLFPDSSGHELTIIPTVPHNDLVKMLSQYDIGLALEQNFPDNKNVTISNKILVYLQAGISVLATATAGQGEVAAFFPGRVAIVEVNAVDEWAKALDKLSGSGETGRKEQLEQFAQVFSWEAQEKKLLPLMSKAINA
jgi:hypothetical protein